MENSKGGMSNGVAVVIAILVVLAIGFFAVFSHKSAEPVTKAVCDPQLEDCSSIGGERSGLQEFNDGIKAGNASQKYVAAAMPVGANSVALYTNRTGQDVYAEYGSVDVVTGQTASTSNAVSIFATSSSATSVPTWADFSTAFSEPKNGLINGLILATSTTASSTNSVMANDAGKGNGSIVIPDGSTLFGYMKQSFNNGCSGSVCEAATSTNRGFNPRFKVRLTTYGNSF